jgi:hypothetical protein
VWTLLAVVSCGLLVAMLATSARAERAPLRLVVIRPDGLPGNRTSGPRWARRTRVLLTAIVPIAAAVLLAPESWRCRMGGPPVALTPTAVRQPWRRNA